MFGLLEFYWKKLEFDTELVLAKDLSCIVELRDFKDYC